MTSEVKRAFAGLIAVDLPGEDGTTTVSGAATRLSQSLSRCFETGKTADLALPRAPSAIEFAALGRPALMSATQLNGYRLMWIFAMFDLPVMTKAQRKAAMKFREFLLDQGFEKGQFSVYARFCNGKEQFETYMRRIESNCRPRRYSHSHLHGQAI